MRKIEYPPLPRLIAVLLIAVPLAAWAVVKPVRVAAPALVGLHCPAQGLCVDDEARRPEAERLYAEAMAFVSERVGAVDGRPRFVFCSTEACAETFGLGERSAVTLGTTGTVIGPRAWKPYYIRHELIHQLQAQEIGTLRLLLKPSWFSEGMAYALSEDPRPELMAPFQDDRARFQRWYADVGKAALWQRARSL